MLATTVEESTSQIAVSATPTAAFTCPEPCGTLHSNITSAKALRHWNRYFVRGKNQPTLVAAPAPVAEPEAPVDTPEEPAAPASTLTKEEERKKRRQERRLARKAKKLGLKPGEPLPQKPVKEKVYVEDPFTVNEDGHFVGHDGFVVPRDFNEFCETYPKYIQRWATKKLNKTSVDDDVMDLAQDLALHMRYLSKDSKFRQPTERHPNGCEDRIQTFDPKLQHGASAPRFFNFVNGVLMNAFLTIVGKDKKNPLRNPYNMSLGNMDDEETGVGDEEYIHSRSEWLTQRTNDDQQQRFDKAFVNEFYDFIREQGEVQVLPVLDAIAQTGTFNEAQAELAMEDNEFSRHRKRIKQLREAFLNATSLPKQRKPYERRALAQA